MAWVALGLIKFHYGNFWVINQGHQLLHPTPGLVFTEKFNWTRSHDLMFNITIIL
ncbi:MAG: hypothetical protein RLP02_06300 [Coleofasciculus sp. C2-GNP5-27]